MAEPLELADELPLVVLGGVASLEVVLAQLLVRDALVQDVVGDHQHRMSHGHGGLARAPATPETVILGVQVGALVRLAALATSLKQPPSHLEPLRVRPERCLPADSLFPGHTPAQEARWAAVGN